MKRPSSTFGRLLLQILWAVHQKNGLTPCVHYSISYLLTRGTHECLEKNRQRLHFTAQVRSFKISFVNPTHSGTRMTRHELGLNKTISQVTSVAHKTRVAAAEKKHVKEFRNSDGECYLAQYLSLCALSYKKERCAGCLPIEPVLRDR